MVRPPIILPLLEPQVQNGIWPRSRHRSRRSRRTARRDYLSVAAVNTDWISTWHPSAEIAGCDAGVSRRPRRWEDGEHGICHPATAHLALKLDTHVAGRNVCWMAAYALSGRLNCRACVSRHSWAQ